MEFKNVKEYFKHIDPDEIEFSAFLRRVKYAFKKVFGTTSVDDGWLSLEPRDSDSRTLWERIKQDGGCSYNCEGIAIDVDYDRVIYVSAWETDLPVI